MHPLSKVRRSLKEQGRFGRHGSKFSSDISLHLVRFGPTLCVAACLGLQFNPRSSDVICKRLEESLWFDSFCRNVLMSVVPGFYKVALYIGHLVFSG